MRNGHRDWYVDGEIAHVGDLVTNARVADEEWAPRCLVIDATLEDGPNLRVITLCNMKSWRAPPEHFKLLSSFKDSVG